MKISSFLPFLQWSRQYQKAWLKADLVAGLTVGVMLIPQAMAYALLAGMPPIYGLYASTLPLLIYAFLGTSRQLSVGPVAMIALLTAAGIGSLAESGSAEYISMAILLALMAGVLQFGFGLFRLGFVVNFLSRPVISGFTSAAGLIIFFSQLKHLLGLQIPRTGYIHQIVIAIFAQAASIHWISLGVGLLAILLIALLKRFKPGIPGPLVVVILGILATYLFRLDQYGMQVVGAVPEGLPSLALPKVSLEAIRTLFPTALAIAMLSFMQSIAAGKALQLRHRDYEIRPNQELIGIGFANIGSALAQGFPVAGGFARSAVNDQAGAKTGFASLISAIIVVLSLLFLTPIFFFLPNTILAAIIMYAAIGLVNIKSARKLWNTYRTDFWLLISTFVATLSLGIEEGIGVGVVLSLVMVIFRSSRPHIAELGRVPDTNIYRNLDRFDELEEHPELLIVRFDAQLYFANLQYFRDQMENLIADKGGVLRSIILSTESINHIDSSGIASLEEWTDDLKSRGIEVYFADVKGPLRDLFYRFGLTERLGKDHFFLSVQNAVDYFFEPEVVANRRQKTSAYTFQRNEWRPRRLLRKKDN